MPNEKGPDPKKEAPKVDPEIQKARHSLTKAKEEKDSSLKGFKGTKTWLSKQRETLSAEKPVPTKMINALDDALKGLEDQTETLEQTELEELMPQSSTDTKTLFNKIVRGAEGLRMELEAALKIRNYTIGVFTEIERRLNEEATKRPPTSSLENALKDASLKIAKLKAEFLQRGPYELTDGVYHEASPHVHDTIQSATEIFDNLRKSFSADRAISPLMIDADPDAPKDEIVELRERIGAEINMQRELITQDTPTDGSREQEYKIKVLKDKYLATLDAYESEYREMSDFRLDNKKADAEVLLKKISGVYDTYSQEKGDK